jgi:hypothetical protein
VVYVFLKHFLITFFCYSIVTGCIQQTESSSFNSEIQCVDEIDEIERVLSTIFDPNTLVLFDCNDVLLSSRGQVFKRNPKKHGMNKNNFDHIIARGRLDIFKERVLRLKQEISSPTKTFLVNDKMPGLIQDLQNRNIPCLVITALTPRPAPRLLNPVEWRIGKLSSFGFHFDRSWPKLQDSLMEEIEGNYKHFFSRGVLFCGSTPKDKSLDAFLKYSNFKPKRIIFIDNKRSNVELIEKYCRKNWIEFIGFHYIECLKQKNS